MHVGNRRHLQSQNEDIRVIEKLAARTVFLGNSRKRSIIGGDLNITQVDWKGIAEGGSVALSINKQNGLGQRVHSGGGKTDTRKFVTGRLPRTTRKCTHILR
jgi:hypothetical protein